MENKKTLALCEGRHEMPACVEGAIFPMEINPLDVDGLYAHAVEAVKGLDSLDLYVTGLSVALAAVITTCNQEGISLTFWHFDRNSGKYYPQPILAFTRCDWCGASAPANASYCPNCGNAI